eukprot:1162010-Pelagomonas_calceolata.AAC.1
MRAKACSLRTLVLQEVPKLESCKLNSPMQGACKGLKYRKTMKCLAGRSVGSFHNSSVENIWKR